MVRFASIVAAAGAAALAACGTARAASDITFAAVATGRLYVIGTTENPHTPVVLEDQFRTESDDKGKFQYELVYHPARCIVSATIEGKTVEAVVSNCSQQCQIGPRSNPAGPAAAAPPPALPGQAGPPALLTPAAGPREPTPATPHNRAAASAAPAHTGAGSAMPPSMGKAAARPPAASKPVQIEHPPKPPQRPVAHAPPQAKTTQPAKPARKPRPSPRDEPDSTGPPIAD
ncbi:hypothetical protein [Methylobacterium sp. NEAU K]|uniref:hypothetical protein n=1 Tax=Methylobacterium sp. NEAU K TaxID=3064946 RepID=UPI0027367FF8|nr:hypothetical protein [Methylobacterium sp. NEAU K]MDP4003604.1 hypothetical protein [Methylobacterium sp. NEAU K]